MRTLSTLAALALLGCGDDDDTQKPGETGDSDTTPESLCPELAEIPCEDDLVQDLLTDDGEVSEGAVTTTADGEDFVTVVDATAGGMNQAANNPWTYFRFDREGATKVEIDDEGALESADWHLAMRRFLVRSNGGDGGPSCVGVAALDGMAYADVAEVPEGTSYALEDFYGESCELRMDAYEMSPLFSIYGWWGYTSCVETTMLPFLVQLETGEVVKLVIEAYYGTGQEECNQSGTLGDDGAMITLRWRFLD